MPQLLGRRISQHHRRREDLRASGLRLNSIDDLVGKDAICSLPDGLPSIDFTSMVAAMICHRFTLYSKSISMPLCAINGFTDHCPMLVILRLGKRIRLV